MKKLVGSDSFPAEQKQAFEHFFARLESVRELRNHIAHGHLLVRITEVGKTPVLTLSLPKDLDATEAPATRHLEFEELTKAQSELAALIDDIQKLTNDWRSESWPAGAWRSASSAESPAEARSTLSPSPFRSG